MIKIEKLKDGAKVFVMREGKRTQVLLNQLVTHAEFATVEVEGGTLVYSVDETEVLEMGPSQGKQLEVTINETVQDAVVTQDTVTTEGVATVDGEERMRITAETTEISTPTVVEAVKTPVIVRPTPRAKK